MSMLAILFINVIMKEKIDCTFKIARFEEFLVVAEVATVMDNPLCICM